MTSLASTAAPPALSVTPPQQQPQLDLNLRLICRDCKDAVPNIVEDFSAGDLICGNCGLILGNRIIDTRSEWRTFSNSDDNSGDPSRVGAASDPILGSKGTIDSTIIGVRDGGTGRSRELHRAHLKVIGQKGEVALLQAFKVIQAMGERISLSKIVIDSAKQLFKKADDERLLKSKPTEAIIAACLYIACREHSVTRTFREICALSKVSKKEIGRCYKALQPNMEHPVQQISLDAYISRFSSSIDIKADVRKATVLVADRIVELGTLAGKSPITLVASCLYFVSCLSTDPKPAKLIAEVAGCTESTLKNAYKLLLEVKDIIGRDLNLPHGLHTLPN
ncbi:hypothetical protein BATDEDRAFT_35027 [Batrachochytrium dendrobatidis JAM81]|uniref:Transcription initiation factor IIB n=2 Tax=Batrachochytrium dendrobatidis TaxID=109871 RepID=F4P235_BATDJ|nr:transcription factor TFIIB [Batrachochytrium dendrobatidis JAM81]EGF81045.1 hypothetical protein BATDEDRAFT_35027 [Batrachochytrium dendrobatidis JAM81]KAJ8329068.1 transcription initiation factor IIB [Batrachochytrium dendrobatidis]KAK5669013.1 transcription initiation factor IIB [Batrachochytrium dendrobatidis]OAJ41936.1 hypothetical protein BDEG_25463 [Batrachochytrium dendrobatidis JEL423]|eukprot:XP_006678593.1 hypothetical protein BATDEDRAFT_35027 [Batrachochytrium dendrobatidis JAM81]